MNDTAAGGATVATRVTIEAVERLDGAVQERLRQMSKGRLREMIPRAIDGKFRMCVPPEPDDDDLILAALIDELWEARAELVALRAVAAAELPTPMLSSLDEDIEGYIRATPKTAVAIAVDYWHLVNWQQEAARLHAELVALRATVSQQAAVVAAARKYCYYQGFIGIETEAAGEAKRYLGRLQDTLADLDTARQHAAPDPPGAARPAAGTAAGPGAGE